MSRGRITFSTRRFLVGKAGPFPRLVFREEVMLSLDQFCHLHPQGEHGGFLIGRKRELKSEEQYEVMVERFVPIPQRDDASRLVITEEHLRTVEGALRGGENPEEIIGWAHTHPGFGVFLSSFDQEQHLRFFSKPWQIAYVMDNQAYERAAYHLADQKWVRLSGYYVLREMAEDEMGITAERPAPWMRLVLGALIVFLVIGAGTYGYTLVRRRLAPAQETQEIFTLPEEPVVFIQEKETLPAQSARPAADLVSSAVGESVAAPASAHREYTVQEGDTLWRIAIKLWGDPSHFLLLAQENDIENPALISVGRVLRVPELPVD